MPKGLKNIIIGVSIGLITMMAGGWVFWVSNGVVEAKVNNVVIQQIAQDVRDLKDYFSLP